MKQEPLSAMWEVVWCQLRLKVRILLVGQVEEDLYFKWYPLELREHIALNRDGDKTRLEPTFLPLDGLLRCHRAVGNNVTDRL
jgi:hypothetical protein